MPGMISRQATAPPWAWLAASAAIVVMLWIAGQTLGRVLFIFLVSVVIALLLNRKLRFFGFQTLINALGGVIAIRLDSGNQLRR